MTTTPTTSQAYAVFAWGEPSEADAEILEPTYLPALSSSSSSSSNHNADNHNNGIHQLSWAIPSDPCSAYLLTTTGQIQLWRPKMEPGQTKPHPGGWFPRNLAAEADHKFEAVAWVELEQSEAKRKTKEQQDTIFITQIASGNRHHAAVTQDGHVLTWGVGYSGQLGLGEDVTTASIPTRVTVPPAVPHHQNPKNRIQFTQVACNINCTLAVSRDGHVYRMGAVHQEAPSVVPRRVDGLLDSPITQISVGSRHAVAVSQNGQCYSWGANDCGQLGIGTVAEETSKPRRTVIPSSSRNDTRIRQVSCGSVHTAVVTEDGHVWVWGDNSYFQCCAVEDEDNDGGSSQPQSANHDKKSFLSTPTRVKEALELFAVVKVACVSSSTFAITEKGELYSWGCGFGGRLGHGSQLPQQQHVPQPQLVSALLGYRTVDVVGSSHVTTALVERPNHCEARRANDTIPFDTVAFGVAVNNPELSDVSFLLESNRTIYAHKFPLAQRSEYFKRMFLSGMQESTSQAAIPVENVRYDVFLALLHYLYTGQLILGKSVEYNNNNNNNNSPIDSDAVADDAMDLYQLSDMYELPKLQSLCWQAVQNHMTVDNAGFLLVKANEMADDALKRLTLTYIRQHFDQVSQTEAMLGVHPSLWQEIVRDLKCSYRN